jgi:ATP-dependent Lon protease
VYDKIMSKISDELPALRKLLKEKDLPPPLVSRISDQLEQIERLQNDISASVYVEQMLSYINWAINLPWNERTVDTLDLMKAKQIFDQNHYGLSDVKDRILEYLAVLKLRGSTDVKTTAETEDAPVHGAFARRAPILCLVGLVGTGKTTLAKSIAQAMGRRFVRIPFGGLADALELRGQSRVRPDAEIGLILKGMRLAGSKNPVILLDEIDRVAEGTRGDIMGVLVELLDPEQNKAFTDHFLDYPFDLSEVLFVATANNTTNIATAVMDRLEPIQMPSYSDEEKIKIAKDYVLPALLQESGLKPEQVSIDDAIWAKLVRPLGYDAGIRSLERNINAMVRKIARQIVEGKGTQFKITEETVKQYVQMY